MLPFLNQFGNYASSDIQVFRANASDTGTSDFWFIWKKPAGKAMLFALGVGGGGSGGGGRSGADLGNRGGGAGGGSATVTTASIPLIYIPDVMYVRVGMGGIGVAAGNTGNLGGRTYISVHPEINGRNMLLSANEGNGGGAGAASGSAVGGAPGAAAAVGSSSISSLGSIQSVAGTIGGAGGAATGQSGANVALPVTLSQPGAGGAGTNSANFTGGGYATNASSWFNRLIPPVATIGGDTASGGMILGPPLYVFQGFGGYGGAAQHDGVGQDGAPGSLGSGGGGGGAGTTGGRGGPGGDGIVIMVCV